MLWKGGKTLGFFFYFWFKIKNGLPLQTIAFGQNVSSYQRGAGRTGDDDCHCEDDCTVDFYEWTADTISLDPDVDCREDELFKALQKKGDV